MRGFELDVGLQATLFLIVAEHAIERVVDGIAIDMRAAAQTGMAAKCLQAHTGVAVDGNRSDTSSRSRDHAKGDIVKLLFGVGCHGLRNGRLVVAVLFEGGAHLGDGAKHFGLGQARSGFELRGALKEGVHGRSGGSVYADSADKRARGSDKDQRHAVCLTRAFDFDGVIEAGFEELTEASLEVFGGERGAFDLSKMAGKRVKALGRDALKGDVQYRGAFPLEDSVIRRGWRWGWSPGFKRASGWGGSGNVGRVLAPGADWCGYGTKKNRCECGRGEESHAMHFKGIEKGIE